MPVDASPDTFDELVREGRVFIDFWGPRCQPCLQMMPMIARFEQEAGGTVKVVKVNTAENRQVCRDLRVFGLPTYILMHDGVELERLSGEVTRADIEHAFETLRGGDGA